VTDVLVYFGYPQAREDDARHAVQAGLEIVSALRTDDASRRKPTRVTAVEARIGIHIGLVVVGEIGDRGTSERLALCETTRQRRIVRTLTPNRRPAAVGPCNPAKCSTVSRCLTLNRYCNRTFTSLSLMITMVSPWAPRLPIKAGKVNPE
jgi:hypothetical protein